jgi:hypothetical protein
MFTTLGVDPWVKNLICSILLIVEVEHLEHNNKIKKLSYTML